KTFFNDRRRIGIRQHVFSKPTFVGQHIVNDAAQKGDIGAGADADENVAQGRGTREARIDVNQRRALLLRLHGPTKAHRVGLRHVGTHNQYAVAIGQVLLIRGGRAPAKRGAQTGHRGTVSYPRLVLDRHDSESTAEQLLDEIVLLDVERR